MRRFLVLCVMVITGAVPAFAFVIGGLAKLHDPFLGASFLASMLGTTLTVGFPLIRALAVLEVACGLLICLLLTRSVLPALFGVCLLGFFLGLLTRMAWLQALTPCGCFGSLWGMAMRRRPGAQILIDSGLLLLLLAHIILVRRLCRPARDPIARASDHSRAPGGRAADGIAQAPASEDVSAAAR